jgi:hypothetical protein
MLAPFFQDEGSQPEDKVIILKRVECKEFQRNGQTLMMIKHA